jgi:protein-S-isoprenylcysteine O-methyltransferase Ste14
VTNGLYRYVRHPLYTAGLLFIWLIPVMTVNLLALNIGLTAYLIVGARYEERKLVKEFGEEYLHYRERTPMLIPRLRFTSDNSPDFLN